MVSSTLASFLSLVVVIGSRLQAVATSSATSATGVPTSCLSEFNTCFEDSTCSECLSGWEADTLDSDCQARYSSVSTGDGCAELGASSCCSLGDESSAESCATNEMFVQYWGCYMGESGCSIEDLPCYSASGTPSPSLTPTVFPQPTSVMPVASTSLSPVFTPSASPLSFPPTVTPNTMENPTAAPIIGTGTPSVSPSLSPSSALSNLTSERELDFTASPTASPSAVEYLFPECSNQTEACLEDDVCQGCMLDSVISDFVGESSDAFSECEIGYLGNTTEAGLCDVAGAMYCCSDDSSGGECLNNDLSTEYWGCVFESLLCSMDEVTCMGGIGGSVRTDDDFYYTDDDADAEEAGSNGATGRWRGPGIVVFALVGIAAAVIPVLGSVMLV